MSTRAIQQSLLPFEATEMAVPALIPMNKADSGVALTEELANVTVDAKGQHITSIVFSHHPESNRAKKTYKRTKDGRIPRPPNCFMLYRHDMHPVVVRQLGTGCNNKDISRKIGEMWHREPETVREKYRKKAEEERINHSQEHPEYKYQPRSRKQKERLREMAEERRRNEHQRLREQTSLPKLSVPAPPMSTSQPIHQVNFMAAAMMAERQAGSDVCLHGLNGIVHPNTAYPAGLIADMTPSNTPFNPPQFFLMPQQLPVQSPSSASYALFAPATKLDMINQWDESTSVHSQALPTHPVSYTAITPNAEADACRSWSSQLPGYQGIVVTGTDSNHSSSIQALMHDDGTDPRLLGMWLSANAASDISVDSVGSAAPLACPPPFIGLPTPTLSGGRLDNCRSVTRSGSVSPVEPTLTPASWPTELSTMPSNMDANLLAPFAHMAPINVVGKQPNNMLPTTSTGPFGSLLQNIVDNIAK